MSFLVSASTFSPKYRILDHLSDSASTIRIILLHRNKRSWCHFSLNTSEHKHHTISYHVKISVRNDVLSTNLGQDGLLIFDTWSRAIFHSDGLQLIRVPGFVGWRWKASLISKTNYEPDLWKVHLRISGIIIDYRFFADTPSLHSHCCFAKNLFQCRRRVDHHMLFQITGIRLHQFGHTPGTWKNHEVSINGHDLQKSHTSFCQVGHHVVEFVHLLGCNGTFVGQKLTTWSTYVKAT